MPDCLAGAARCVMACALGAADLDRATSISNYSLPISSANCDASAKVRAPQVILAILRVSAFPGSLTSVIRCGKRLTLQRQSHRCADKADSRIHGHVGGGHPEITSGCGREAIYWSLICN